MNLTIVGVQRVLGIYVWYCMGFETKKNEQDESGGGGGGAVDGAARATSSAHTKTAFS